MSFLRDRLRWLAATAIGLVAGWLLHSVWLAFAVAAALALLLALLMFAARIADHVDTGDDEFTS